MLVNRPVTHKLTNNQPFFNTSNFATQAGNPVLTEMFTEMNGRFVKNKAYFEANRPTATRDAAGQVNYTPEFLEYEGKVFETVGPRMFDDVLKSRRPDIYNAGFDGMSKETRQVNGRLQPGMPFDVESDIRQYYQRKGLMAPDGFQQNVQEAKKHYQAFREQLQIKIGAEHSWIDA